MPKFTEIRGGQIGIDSFETPQGKFWRVTIMDGGDIVFADIPDEVARAIATKITSGVHIDVASRLPDGLKLQ